LARRADIVARPFVHGSPSTPRITPIAGPILGEFLVGISVTMAALWMASQISDAAGGGFNLRQQVLESLFVLFRVLALGAGAAAALWLLLADDWTLGVLNAPPAPSRAERLDDSGSRPSPVPRMSQGRGFARRTPTQVRLAGA
jgi:hypothetical protein